MGRRIELQEKLEEILGSREVYFQPPSTVKLKYPCIIYNRNYIKITHADNAPYRLANRYMVTVIDLNPDSEIPDKIAHLSGVSFSRFYTADNLNHWAFEVYF